jgi:hypothetical protein
MSNEVSETRTVAQMYKDTKNYISKRICENNQRCLDSTQPKINNGKIEI